MEDQGSIEQVVPLSDTLLQRAQEAVSGLSTLGAKWTLIQIAIIVALFVVALLLTRLIEPRLEERVRAVRERPRLLRFLAIVLRRTRWVVLALLLWVASWVMREVTWPSRSYFVYLAAALTTAWFLISVVSRLIRNRMLSRVVAIGAWAYVALNVLDIYDTTVGILDGVAISMGDLRLSVWLAIKGAVFLALFLWLANATAGLIDRQLQRAEDITPSLQVLIGKITKILLITLAVFIALSSIGIDLTALAVFSGAVGLGLGFGLQKVVSNFVSGVIILLDKSIKPGDVITLGDTFGWISMLRARYVSVVTRDGREFLIPNEDFITTQVVNWSFTDRQVRLEVTFGVSYDSDPHEVRKLAVEAAQSAERVAARPQPVCHLTNFGDSNIDFVLRFWIKDPEGGVANVRGLVLLALWDAFKAAGVEFAFPHRELILRSPVEVRQVKSGATRLASKDT